MISEVPGLFIVLSLRQTRMHACMHALYKILLNAMMIVIKIRTKMLITCVIKN